MNHPQEIAVHTVESGIKKAKLSIPKAIILGFFAGVYIAIAASGSNVVATAFGDAAGRVASALVFPVGFIIVIIAGAELFTSDCLMVVALYERKISVRAFIRTIICVYFGNLLGALTIAAATVFGGQFDLFGDGLMLHTVTAAIVKCSASPVSLFVLGVLCNILVCSAVWMSYGAKTVGSKAVALYFPIMLFMICGFEHSVANMFYIPAALFAKALNSNAAVLSGVELSALTPDSMISVLTLTSIGNLVGGGLIVALLYRFIYFGGKDKSLDKKD